MCEVVDLLLRSFEVVANNLILSTDHGCNLLLGLLEGALESLDVGRRRLTAGELVLRGSSGTLVDKDELGRFRVLVRED